MFTELNNRGLEDVLMLVCDGLNGLPRGVETVWPRTIVQTSIVHLLRNSFGYGAPRTGTTRQGPQARLQRPDRGGGRDAVPGVRCRVGQDVSGVVKLWSDAWASFLPFLACDVEIPNVICSTNAIWVLYFCHLILQQRFAIPAGQEPDSEGRRLMLR